MSIKQVIVIRKDLGMRRGKEIAQGSHASMAFITRRLEYKEKLVKSHYYHELGFSNEEYQWLESGFTKICLKVNSEEELIKIYNDAKSLGLEVHLVTDSGKTEFNGVPTKTCLAIGPDKSELIDKVTGHLVLY